MDVVERVDRAAARILAHRMVREAGFSVERREACDRRWIDVMGGEDALR